MTSRIASTITELIQHQALPAGGFTEIAGKEYRPDVTAWTAMALAANGTNSGLIEPSLNRLESSQLDDGRICISKHHPAAFWPTSLAILAWMRSQQHSRAREHAVQFLLNTSGKHYIREANSPIGHDTSIRGWPWVANTHSWIEPTALAICALTLEGAADHPRVKEATAMIDDRQLSHGGWNYGNTTVYGQELLPMPDSTGLALQALVGRTKRIRLAKSIAWLLSQVEHLSTPVSLSWGIIGLSAWGERPHHAEALIERCLANQDRYGTYPTSSLALLLLALCSPNGILASNTNRKDHA